MIPPRTIVFFERGINGWQSIVGSWRNWPNQAIVWAFKNRPGTEAQTLLYWTSPIMAGLTRKYRAGQFADLIRQYSNEDWNIIIIAHSEGAATTLEAVRLSGSIIKELHLVCGACDSNFERNGLNNLLVTNLVGKVFCYTADNDMAMKIEDTLLGLAMFGIAWNDCPLGLSGPKNVKPWLLGSRVTEHHWPDYGHSYCFFPQNFDATMRLLLP